MCVFQGGVSLSQFSTLFFLPSAPTGILSPIRLHPTPSRRTQTCLHSLKCSILVKKSLEFISCIELWGRDFLLCTWLRATVEKVQTLCDLFRFPSALLPPPSLLLNTHRAMECLLKFSSFSSSIPPKGGRVNSGPHDSPRQDGSWSLIYICLFPLLLTAFWSNKHTWKGVFYIKHMGFERHSLDKEGKVSFFYSVAN